MLIKNARAEKVAESDFYNNMEALVKAAKAGRLVILQPKKKVPSREEIIRNVRPYVRQISGLASIEWQDNVETLWDALLEAVDIIEFLTPNTKTRKFRDFNKNNLMRLVGYLRNKGVYIEKYDKKIVNILEHSEKDDSIRSYMGKGLDKIYADIVISIIKNQRILM